MCAGISSAWTSKPGLKTIHRATVDPFEMHRSPVRALMRFAMLIAIDTNTVIMDGARVSVSVMIIAMNLHFDPAEPRRWHATVKHQDALEFRDTALSSERVGWQSAIERAVSTPASNARWRDC
jgi:hypothetical protein